VPGVTTIDSEEDSIWRRFVRAPEAKSLAFLILVVGFFSLMNPAFLSGASFMAILQALAFIGIVSVGMTLLIVAGEFDLSVGSVATLANVTAALLMVNAGLDPVLSLIMGLGVGALVGAINAIFVLSFDVPSFIATIGMMFIARGLAVWLSAAKPILPLPPIANQIGDVSVLGLSLSVLVFLLLVVAGAFVLARTNFGCLIRATGGNLEAADIAGVKTNRTKFQLFVLSGTLAGLAGTLTLVHFGAGTHEMGNGWELTAIAAVVIGGTSLFGGAGTVIGTFFGLMILHSIAFGMVAARIDPWWQIVATGVIMLLSLTAEAVGRRRRPFP
jgi:ribose transport system permease protein